MAYVFKMNENTQSLSVGLGKKIKQTKIREQNTFELIWASQIALYAAQHSEAVPELPVT